VVTQLAGWEAVQDPVTALAPAHRAGTHELAKCRRDRGPVCADKRGEALVRKRQGNHYAVLTYAAPTLSQVPEREHQAVVDAGMMGNRKRDGKRMRPSGSAVEELDAELRPRDNASYELLVQDSEASWFEHGPPDFGMDVRALVVPVPRPHYVAVTEQLDALAAEHLDVTRYQAVGYQEAAVMAFGLD
jgi:hypothetical protein